MFNTLFELPLSSSVRKNVLSASRQYHQSKSFNIFDKTARFLHCVYAIETLVNAEDPSSSRCEGCGHGDCKGCGQPIFSVSKKFRAFIQKYSNNYNKKNVNEIYKLRSSIVHTGNYFSNYEFFLYDDDDSNKKYIQKYLNDRIFQITDNIFSNHR